MPYTHLSSIERDKIAQMHFSGLSYSEIGRHLGRHKSTISREVNRNRVRRSRRFVHWSYLSSQAALLASKRRANACLLYTSPSPRDATLSRMPSSA